jgi:hypothetical protein
MAQPLGLVNQRAIPELDGSVRHAEGTETHTHVQNLLGRPFEHLRDEECFFREINASPGHTLS